MTNLLADYQDIVETYLIGLRTQLNANFRFHMNLEEGSVSLLRDIPELSKCKTLAIKYISDKETLEDEKPSAELLKVYLWTLKGVITQSIMRFSDKFYQDRANGVPFVDDTVLDIQDRQGNIKTIRVDSIDWVEFFNVI